jgi:hypothetical protein
MQQQQQNQQNYNQHANQKNCYVPANINNLKIINSNQSLNTHNLISPHGKTFICEPSSNRMYPEYLREGRTQSVLHYYHGINQLGAKNNYVNPNMNNSHSPSTRPDKIIPAKLAQNSSG